MREPFLSFRVETLARLRDTVSVRDPAGASPRPCLVEDRGRVFAFRKFGLILDYRVSRDSALRFLEITRDDNPIHIQGDIVPGALTISKPLLLMEVLLDGFGVSGVKAKFTGAAFYGERTVSQFFLSPGTGEGTVSAEIVTYQAGRIIAKAEVSGSLRPRPPLQIPAQQAGSPPMPENLDLVRMFHEALAIEPGPCAESGGQGTWFPSAFLASLPSGEMVRQFKGEGGMLNVLSLDFEHPRCPLSAPAPPVVRLEKGRAGPMSFSRIHARIIGGARTYGEGFALVNRPS